MPNRMSGIETNSGSQKLTTYPKGATTLPVELLIVVMKYLPDLAALSRLSTAYPQTLTDLENPATEILLSSRFLPAS